MVLCLALVPSGCVRADPPPSSISDPSLIDAEECGGTRWPVGALPLRVYIHPIADSWKGTTRAAMEWWGEDWFVETSTSVDADVVVGADPEMYGRAVTWLDYDKQTCLIDGPIAVVLPFIGPGLGGIHMVAHELGHVLGLGHDTLDPGSLMYPTLTESSLRGDDRIRLRTLYNREPGAVP